MSLKFSTIKHFNPPQNLVFCFHLHSKANSFPPKTSHGGAAVPLKLPACPSPTNTHQPRKGTQLIPLRSPSPPPPGPPGLRRGGEAQLDHLANAASPVRARRPAALCRVRFGPQSQTERRVAAKKETQQRLTQQRLQPKDGLASLKSGLCACNTTRGPLTVCLCVCVSVCE